MSSCPTCQVNCGSSAHASFSSAQESSPSAYICDLNVFTVKGSLYRLFHLWVGNKKNATIAAKTCLHNRSTGLLGSHFGGSRRLQHSVRIGPLLTTGAETSPEKSRPTLGWSRLWLPSCFVTDSSSITSPK